MIVESLEPGLAQLPSSASVGRDAHGQGAFVRRPEGSGIFSLFMAVDNSFTFRYLYRVQFCRIGLRGLLSAAVVVSAFLLAAYFWYMFRHTPDQIPVTNYDEYRKQALELVLQESGSLFNIGILILGALWATLVAGKDNRLVWSDSKPETISFFVSNGLMIAFFIFDWKYTRLLTQLLWSMGPLLSGDEKFADIVNSDYVGLHYSAMVWFFYGAIGSSALCVLSACLLRSRP